MTVIGYQWRPDVNDWSYAHLAEDGQIRRTSADTPGRQWVPAVCPGGRVSPDGPAIVGAERCRECRQWEAWRQGDVGPSSGHVVS